METQTKTTSQEIRKRNSSTVPFGWNIHPKNDHLLIKNDSEYDMITQMKELAETQSLRAIGRFVKAHTGRSITPRGITRILKRGY
jgi:hypothetical protein